MSEMARTSRAAMKAKAHRIAEGDPHAKVDASGWTPPEALNTEAKTGLRPVSRRAYKRGGTIEGKEAHANGGRAPRKAGGNVRAYAQDDTKAENAEKFGNPHVGGRKSGGRAGKAAGGVPTAMLGFTGKRGTPLPGSGATEMKRGGHADAKQDAKQIHKMVKSSCMKTSGGKADGVIEGTRPTGGRKARKEGGRTKGKTNINIIISAGGKQQPPMPPVMPPGAAPMPVPPPMPPAGGPPSGGPPMPPPGAMPRKSGGRAAPRTSGYFNLEAGSGSALGRLQKAHGKKP